MQAILTLVCIALAFIGCNSALARETRSSLRPPASRILACGLDCKTYLQSVFEARAAVEAGSAYSEVKCATIRFEKSVPFRVGARYAGTLGGGRGLLNARITVRCVPYSGREPVILIRNFTIDADFHICDRTSLDVHVDRRACPSLL